MEQEEIEKLIHDYVKHNLDIEVSVDEVDTDLVNISIKLNEETICYDWFSKATQ